jgi:hypothetical protein
MSVPPSLRLSALARALSHESGRLARTAHSTPPTRATTTPHHTTPHRTTGSACLPACLFRLRARQGTNAGLVATGLVRRPPQRNKAVWRGHTGTGERGRIGPFHAATTQRPAVVLLSAAHRRRRAHAFRSQRPSQRGSRDQRLLYAEESTRPHCSHALMDVDVLGLAGTRH